MSSKGRYGDTMLVHMAPSEVSGLHALARAHGEKLTINPETGLPEAFKLKSLLPMILGVALAPATGGASLGLTSAWQTAALVGAGYGLAKGSLKEGLIAGLGAYGGAGLAASLGAAGVSEVAAQNALGQQAAGTSAFQQGMMPTTAELAAAETAANTTATTTASTTPTAAQAASDISGHGYGAPGSNFMPAVETVTQAPPVQGAPVDPGMLSTAGYTPAPPPTGLEALKQGAQSIYDKGTFGEFAKANKNALYAAGASALMAPEDEEGMPETKRDPGYIRPARYDWRTGKYEYFEPVDASKWGTRNLSEYTNARDPNARTPIGRKAGGLMALANGGAIAFADGGATDPNEALKRLESINEFLKTNPSADALAAAQAQYGVDNAELARAREYGNVGAPPGTPGVETGNVVVGGGGYSSFEMPGGTVKEGYSRDYTPEQRIGINEAFIRSQKDAGYGTQGLMADMEKTGVTANDLALSRGLDKNSVNQYLVRGGADLDFMGIDTGMDKAKLDAFIKAQNAAPNPYGQGTMGDVFRKQGISDTDPIRYAQAQEIVEREARRNLMRTSAGADPVVGPGGGGGTTPGPTTPGPTTPGPTTPGPYTPTPGPSNPQQPVPNTPSIDAVTTGGSRDAYKYLSGQGAYPVSPFLPEGKKVGEEYWKAMGMTDPYKGPKVADELTNPNATPKTAPPAGKKWVWNPTDRKWVTEALVTTVTPPASSAGDTAKNGGLMPRRMALGGLGALAGGGAASQYNLGGYSDGGRLLRGPGDGVSDDIPATIGNKQPARLADGEFVVPARIVSELGNGSTEAGARKLYAMMDRVQRARGKTTGKNRVATNSRADKHLPA
jgi:hypothetical protein